MSEAFNRDPYNLWEHLAHLDAIFNERLNSFLILESVLLAASGVILSRQTAEKPVLLAIMSLGLILTVIWGVHQMAVISMFESARTRLREISPEYDAMLRSRDRIAWLLGGRKLLIFTIPPSIFLIWIVLLVYTIIL